MSNNRLGKITQGVDFHKFQRVTIDDSYAFHEDADVEFAFRHSNLSFSLLLDGYGSVEYSFNGNTVHGDLVMGMPSQAIFFDNRNVPGIWFRATSAVSVGSTVRVEGWKI